MVTTDRYVQDSERQSIPPFVPRRSDCTEADGYPCSGDPHSPPHTRVEKPVAGGVTDPRLRATVVDYARRLHARGWVANHDGNITVRIGEDRYLVTPTATSKAEPHSLAHLLPGRQPTHSKFRSLTAR